MDPTRLKRTSLFDRRSLAQRDAIAQPPAPGASFSDFWGSLPDHLKACDLRSLVAAIQNARSENKPIIWMMGAHPIKVGLNRWLIEAIERGFVSALALNGACFVHDFELALSGSTSEDVAESLIDGSFGMTRETGETLNRWIVEAAKVERGLGESVAQQLAESGYEYSSLSVLAAAWRRQVPVTAHIALGAEVFHHHPEASGEALGKTSLHDFHRLCDLVAEIGEGGVALNVGSAVVLPEVFLKALTVARNIHGPIHNFTTANFDMIQHYRPNQNVVQRPTLGGGKGYAFTGHHEIMLPLFLMALFSEVSS